VPAATTIATASPSADLSKIGKPSTVVVTPFADAPETTRVAMNPQRISEAPPPAAPIATPAAPAGPLPHEAKGVSPPPDAKVAATPSDAKVAATPSPAAPVAAATPPAPGAPKASPEIPALASGWTVVVAALNSADGATEAVQRLRGRGLPADIFVFNKDGQRMYRLGLGRFASYEAAAVYAARVRKELPEFQPWIAAFGAAPS
jgi:cell division septation protein DedD